MNDKTVGALEALSFAKSKVKDSKARREIQSAIDLIVDGAATDFKIRAKYW